LYYDLLRSILRDVVMTEDEKVVGVGVDVDVAAGMVAVAGAVVVVLLR